MENKIVFMSDFDGTLLTDDKSILKKDLDSINKFKMNGGRFGIATGRTLHGSSRYFEILQPNLPSIFYNGSVIYDIESKKVLYEKNLPDTSVEIVQEIMNKFPNVMAEILRVDEIYCFNINEIGQRQIIWCDEDVPDMTFDEIPKDKWLKVLFAGTPEQIDELYRYVLEENYGGMDFVKSESVYLEFLPKGSSKGTALKYLKENLLEKNTMVAAMGDFNNDIEMLKEANFSAAPSSAAGDVKAAAGFVTKKDNNTGAVSEFISGLLKEYF